jgi:hypothetical protein
MKSEHTLPRPKASSREKLDDHYKLVSLLTLATGAVAMPQTGHADIFYTDLSSSPVQVGYLTNSSYVIDNLPGDARLDFLTVLRSNGSRIVVVGQAAGFVRLKTNSYFAVAASQSKHWDDIAGGSSEAHPTAGVANPSGHNPLSFDNRYYAFKFTDITQGNATCYGWVKISLDNSDLSVGNGPQVTIFGWAYDTIPDAQIRTGYVPEPAPMAMLALGALTLGANGLRSWRRQRVPAGKS